LQCYLKLGDNAKAAADCTACLTLTPDNAKALYRRAVALEALGESKAALRDYRDLLRSNPGISNASEAVKRLEKALGIAQAPQPTRKLQLTVRLHYLQLKSRDRPACGRVEQEFFLY
jgi:tetratricopeptide (TPR) repeat protein